MTDILWEDSKARHMLHSIINCIQALGGYCELGELDKAIAMTFECGSSLTALRAELENMKADEVES